MTPTEFIKALPDYDLVLNKDDEAMKNHSLSAAVKRMSELEGRLEALFEVDPATGNYTLSAMVIYEADGLFSFLGIPARSAKLFISDADKAIAYVIFRLSGDSGASFDEKFTARIEKILLDYEDRIFFWSTNKDQWALGFERSSVNRGKLRLYLMDLTRPRARWLYDELRGIDSTEPEVADYDQLFAENIKGLYKYMFNSRPAVRLGVGHYLQLGQTRAQIKAGLGKLGLGYQVDEEKQSLLVCTDEAATTSSGLGVVFEGKGDEARSAVIMVLPGYSEDYFGAPGHDIPTLSDSLMYGLDMNRDRVFATEASALVYPDMNQSWMLLLGKNGMVRLMDLKSQSGQTVFKTILPVMRQHPFWESQTRNKTFE